MLSLFLSIAYLAISFIINDLVAPYNITNIWKKILFYLLSAPAKLISYFTDKPAHYVSNLPFVQKIAVWFVK